MIVEDVAGSTEARRERAGRSVAFPEGARGITEFVVPLCPAWRKAADLVAARTAIPRFGDQFDSAEHGILAARLEEAALVVEAVWLAGENRAEIKAKAIDF